MKPRPKTVIWATLSVAVLAGAVISVLNFLAAADLGYDTSEQGRIILQRWSDATLFASACCIVCAILAFRSSRRSV